MDTRDRDSELAQPGVMLPDTGMALPPRETVDPSRSMAEMMVAPIPAEGADQAAEKSPTPLQDSLRRLRRNARAMVCLGIIILFVMIAIVGPLIYQHVGGIYKSSLYGAQPPSVYHSFSNQEQDRLDEGPSAQYWLGTDSLGRDLLARLMQGMLISLLVAFVVEIVDIGLGVTIGVLAGYYGGWIDQLLARFTDIMFAFPGVLFVILLTGIFGTWADDKLSAIPIIGENG